MPLGHPANDEERRMNVEFREQVKNLPGALDNDRGKRIPVGRIGGGFHLDQVEPILNIE